MSDKQVKTSTKKTGTRNKNRDEAVQKAKSSNENSEGLQQEQQQVEVSFKAKDINGEEKEIDYTLDVSNKKAYQLGDQVIPVPEEVDITPYISNVDGSVYAISGLPEEFIATLFAWVSRSSKSFKEHLRTALKDQNVGGSLDAFKTLDDKAKAFHEKWTVGYGHSSVAEHATAHVGIESISRLASAELELANSFLSITEYSQRYQKPERFKWHNPFEKPAMETWDYGLGNLHDDVDAFYNKAFDAFENLIDGVYKHLKSEYETTQKFKNLKKRQKENDTNIEALTQIDKELRADYSALKKIAFEDARYVLPLAMHTQLGITANGRAWRDALAVLGNSDHVESVKLADDLRGEITKVLPVLLKYATPSQYQRNSKKRMKARFNKPTNNARLHQFGSVLMSVTAEDSLVEQIISHLLVKHENHTYANALAFVRHGMTKEEKETIIKELLFEMQHFDMAPDEFKHVHYEAYFTVSEANWHQLLRHNRMTDFTFSNPNPFLGIKIPPRILEAGLQDIVKDIAGLSEELYNRLVEEGFTKEAEYVVLNAHKRHIFASFNLWEAYHLINLRTSEEAQWDIRETFEDLFKQLNAVHPLLMSQAKRRLN